ncbi:MAG TPA: DUF6350 family protein [Streptosporangiaceae bacterium]|nr:DUF6350 family protein [Streptosporangiaceae bacterium]
MAVSAEAPPSSVPGSAGRSGRGSRPARPLVVTGAIAACAGAASGLAVLVTLTAIGWITAPHVGIGSGLTGVLRTAAMLWLVAHHVGFTVRGAGRIGMLPLGLVLLPGALLFLAGRWVVHAGAVTRLRHVGYAAVALALPYTLLAGAVAVASRTAQVAPTLWQAVVASFLLALVAGGLGAARAVAPWSRLVGRLMPARPRSIVMGMLASVAILTAAGAVLAGGSLVVHLSEVRAATGALDPGPMGAALLLLAQLAYVPNAIVWAVAYTLGPGFAFGTGTFVAPTGSALGTVPIFPMLAALPGGARPGGQGWDAVLVLAVPYLAGAFGGIVTARITPTPVIEAAPLWGFIAGAAAGGLAGLTAAFSGGPLGDGRLAVVGPSGWQVSLVAVLEIGVPAALTAAATNWLILRKGSRRRVADRLVQDEDAAVAGWVTAGIVDETDDAEGHRIYLNPWAAYDLDERDEPDDELPLPAVLQEADLAADRVGELGMARLLSGNRVRAAHAGVISVHLWPEHREDQEPQGTERKAEAAQDDAADGPARPRRTAAPCFPARADAQPDRYHGEHQGQHGYVDSAVQVAKPEREAEQAEHAHRECRQGTLTQGGIGRRQLPGR